MNWLTSPTLWIGLTLVLLLWLRWVHRGWGRALMAALFAPVLVAPLAAVGFLAATFVIRLLTWIPARAGFEVSPEAVQGAAGILTSLLLLAGAIHYTREQRHLSSIEGGSRIGSSLPPSGPRVFQRNRLR